MEDSVARNITRRAFTTALAALPLATRALAAPVRRDPSFEVLSLFHPTRLLLRAEQRALLLSLDGLASTLRSGDVIDLRAPSRLRTIGPADFTLEVPGKLRRSYCGLLSIDTPGTELRAIVRIERELAVASIVAAESWPGATANDLRAQAIASRSFMLGAGTMHAPADFCDATHCQFLREPPPKESTHAAAAQHTSGLILRFRTESGEKTLAAMYSRSCGGRTRTLAELGLPIRGYPYYAVECAFCRAHPEVWRRDAAAVMGERERLAFNRVHGWSAMPGHIDVVDALGVSGRGVGHGLGLCQVGAAAMAARGASFADILAHYYPNTVLARV